MRNNLYAVIFFSFLALAALLRLIAANDSLSYTDYQSLEYSGVGCSQQSGPSHVFHSLERIATWNKSQATQTAACASEWFTAKGTVVELAVAGYTSANRPKSVSLSIESEDGSYKQTIHPPLRGAPEGWRVQRFFLPVEVKPTNKLRFLVVDDSEDAGWIAVRNRINFYTAATNSFSRILASIPSAGVLPLTMVIFLCLVFSIAYLLSNIPQSNSKIHIFFVLFASAAFLHVRSEAFFHMDDWALLERFERLGLKAIFEAHNEHVIPLSLSILFLEVKAFGQNYLYYQLLACSFLAANGLLLFALSRKLFPDIKEHSHRLLAFAYVVCGLQAEVIQWMICQSTLLSTSFILLTLLALIEFQRSKKLSNAFSVFIYTIAAPLSAAWGFTLILLIPLTCFVTSGSARNKQNIKKWGVLAASFTAASLIVAFFYAKFRSGVGHTLDTFEPPSFSDGLSFTYFASQISVVLRGTGLYPIADSQLRTLQSSSTILGIFALVILILLTFTFMRASIAQRHRKLLLILALLIAPLALVGIGRSPDLALTFRYTNLSLIGLYLLLTPLVDAISLRARHILLLAFVASQLHLSLSYRRYHNFGSEMRRYLARVESWESIPLKDKMRPGELLNDGQGPIVFGGDAEHCVALQPILHPSTKLALLKNM